MFFNCLLHLETNKTKLNRNINNENRGIPDSYVIEILYMLHGTAAFNSWSKSKTFFFLWLLVPLKNKFDHVYHFPYCLQLLHPENE